MEAEQKVECIKVQRGPRKTAGGELLQSMEGSGPWVVQLEAIEGPGAAEGQRIRNQTYHFQSLEDAAVL